MNRTMPTLPGIPEQIARYQLLSELGRGSMGHVYLALDPNIDRKVAIKIFLPLLKVGVAEQWELRQRFVFEARAAGQLNHPGIVTIFDADTDPDTGLSYLAMEWVNGPSLEDLIRESGPLAIDRSVTIVEQVAVALDVAHRQGLVHRDIKPANILLENNGRAKVTDFGIAKLASMSITTTGWIPGSPFYMSPEQIRNEGIDRRSDLYALGAVLYQCLTGTLPFEAESLAALTHMILEIDPRPVRSVNPSVSTDLAAVIDTALAKSPDDRFDSGREFARALRLAKAGQFKSPARRGVGAAGRAAGAEPVTAVLAEGIGTGTIGLAEGETDLGMPVDPDADSPPPTLEPETAATSQVEAARRAAAVVLPGDPARARSGSVGRLAVALGIVLVVVAVWSLRPVQSEPASDAPPIVRLFSRAPRFATDAPAAGGGLAVLVEPPEPAEAVEPSDPSQPSAVVEAGRSTAGGAVGEPPGRRPAKEAGGTTAPGTATAVPGAARVPTGELAGDPGAAEGEPTAGPSGSETASVPHREPAVRATSTLEVVYRNRLQNASLTVSIDGRRVYSGDVATPPSFFKRVVGKNVWTSLELTPGRHFVDVRVTGAEGKLDLVRRATGIFEDGRTHRLRATVTPLKKLKLTWKESPGG